MSTLVYTSAAIDETCRSKKQIPTESCKLWMESLRRCRLIARWVRPLVDVFIQQLFYLIVLTLHLPDSDIERDLPYRSTCWWTLLLCLLLPLLLFQYASCSPGVSNVKTVSTPGQDESFEQIQKQGLTPAVRKAVSVSETRSCSLTTRR